MSEIKAIDKLLDELKVCGCDPDECMSCSVPRKVKDGLANVEAEIAERFILAPVDADGVPIHMGDTVKGELLDGSTVRGTVSAFHLYNDEPDSVYIHVDVSGGWTVKELRLTRCRHYEPRTLEDALEEFADAAADVDGRDREEWEPLLAKYADEIREIMEDRK